MSAVVVSQGVKIPYTPDAAVTAGDVVVSGSIVGVVEGDLAASQKGSLIVDGICEFPKDTGSASALTQGTKVYWDADNEVITSTAGSNKCAGYVSEAAAASDTTVRVLLSRA